MRKNIHPEYREIEISCVCGHQFSYGSTYGKALKIEVCDQCHPFYTGKQRHTEAAGRAERFQKKYNMSSLIKKS